MNIFELEKKVDEITGGKKWREKAEELYELYDNSFTVTNIPSDEILAIIRKFDGMVIREEDGIKYLDKPLREMATMVAFFTQCTDLNMDVLDGESQNKTDMVAVYDVIKRIGLEFYMYSRDYAIMETFEHFRQLEEEVFFDKQRRVSNNAVSVSNME